MPLLHIYDSSDRLIRQTAGARGASTTLPCTTFQDCWQGLDRYVGTAAPFDRILFETHGGPGSISFGDGRVDASHWRGCANRNWTTVVTSNARIYFNGCNVAESQAGWEFLKEVGKLFLKPGGGSVFGQTSVGFGNPFNGHVVHLWGSVRTVYFDQNGRILEMTET